MMIKEIVRECLLLLRIISGAVGVSALLLPIFFALKASEKRWEGCLCFIGSLIVSAISLLLAFSFIFFAVEAPDEEVMILLVPILLWLDLNIVTFGCKVFEGRAKIVMEALQLVFFILYLIKRIKIFVNFSIIL